MDRHEVPPPDRDLNFLRGDGKGAATIQVEGPDCPVGEFQTDRVSIEALGKGEDLMHISDKEPDKIDDVKGEIE